MIKFTREALATTEAGKLIENEKVLTRKEKFREKLANDPNMIKRGYEHGWIMFGDRLLFVRSRWDANMCAYYEFLKNQGTILNWYYEPIIFWFDKIKRGTNNYKPDFKIEQDPIIEYYVEIKGFWTQKDTVKQKRMKKYHPYVVMTYVKQEDYKRIASQFDWIPGWNQPFMKREQIAHLLPIKTKKTKKAL